MCLGWGGIELVWCLNIGLVLGLEDRGRLLELEDRASTGA